jgi:hypothetical protein
MEKRYREIRGFGDGIIAGYRKEAASVPRKDGRVKLQVASES